MLWSKGVSLSLYLKTLETLITDFTMRQKSVEGPQQLCHYGQIACGLQFTLNGNSLPWTRMFNSLLSKSQYQMLLSMFIIVAHQKSIKKIQASCVYQWPSLPSVKVFTSHFTICSSWIIFIKRSVRSRSVQAGREKRGFHHNINHRGILLSRWINCGATASPQPRTSIASRFQWGSKIKVQIQLLFCVADLWVFCLIYVTLIEVSKEIAAGSRTKGSHRVFQKLHWEAAIKTKWVPHLRIMRESCLAKSCLEHPLFTLLWVTRELWWGIGI